MIIECKCGRTYIAEQHGESSKPVNEFGFWHTCPGCGTTGLIPSESSKRVFREEGAA